MFAEGEEDSPFSFPFTSAIAHFFFFAFLLR
jgi:hypothetical protein